MSLLSTIGIIFLACLILGLIIALILWRKGKGSLALGWRCLSWDIEYLAVSMRINSLMRATGDTGGESSPYFEDLQEAFREEAELRQRHPIAKSA